MKTLDTKLLKKTLGKYLTGVTIVTSTDHDGNPIGMTVNSFTSVSLQPSLVLWCIDKKQPSYNSFMNANGYAVNILSKDQNDLCYKFASQLDDKFENVNWKRSENGFPLVKNSLAWFDCKKWNYYSGGDHQILVGEVTSFDSFELEPLTYWNGQIS
tara:strand:- start:675 stop:1142 length:468 start_codon:yes stop_codon:yes gene_type:complete